MNNAYPTFPNPAGIGSGQGYESLQPQVQPQMQPQMPQDYPQNPPMDPNSPLLKSPWAHVAYG